MHQENFIPYEYEVLSEDEALLRSRQFLELMNSRRTVREFSSRPVPEEIIKNIIQVAGTAPSGAHKQPYTFCVVSNDELKSKIRKMAEQEEFINYNGRMSEEWLDDLKVFGTNYQKPFIEEAPYLIVVFKKSYNLNEGEKTRNYYVNESVGIAVGMLLAAIHNAGLAALTHTPSPMNFLAEALGRPKNEKAYLNIPVGYPKEDVQVPDIKRKSLDEIAKFYR
ncbi:MAG: nitroreductase family protein [Flavobacteriales bacterium]|jgi:nitroreductase|nr:nitroreductase family protein [Flavobacteriales bacterium]